VGLNEAVQTKCSPITFNKVPMLQKLD